MSFRESTEQLLADFRAQRPLRAGSLIITVYGDALAPRGGNAWLGSLITLLEAFGLNQRLVRTSVFRLVKDDWLHATRQGRRSYYDLTQQGQRRFEAATKRIYGGPPADWDHNWCLVLLDGDTNQRERLRRELGWQGFGMLIAGLLAHPAPDRDALLASLQDINVRDSSVVMHATSDDITSGKSLKRLVQKVWALDELEAGYRHFLKRFAPILKQIQSRKGITDEHCLYVRLLMIHEYRRVLLRDPQLPGELLPSKWPGHDAYELCRALYRRVQAGSERRLSSLVEALNGPLPPPEPSFTKRFIAEK